jgi:hypothetical protein
MLRQTVEERHHHRLLRRPYTFQFDDLGYIRPARQLAERPKPATARAARR